MPLSSLWHVVNKEEVPVNAVWLSAAVAFVMALTVSFSLQTSMACFLQDKHDSNLRYGR